MKRISKMEMVISVLVILLPSCFLKMWVSSILLAGIHLLCLVFTLWDQKGRKQSVKVTRLVLWTCPVISLFSYGMMAGTSLEKGFDPYKTTILFCGGLFSVIGNYLPKCTQNRTIGIKVKWTLENEENWNATHRMAGKVWTAGGVIMMLSAFLPEDIGYIIIIAAIWILIIVPILYSYDYHRKQKTEAQKVNKTGVGEKGNKMIALCSLAAVAIIAACTAVLMFTGEITILFEEEKMILNASYWTDLTVEYKDIESIELIEEDKVGTRTFGLGSARLLAGKFHHQELGNYTRYSYTNGKSCIHMRVNDELIVVNEKNDDMTKKLYNTICDRVEMKIR